MIKDSIYDELLLEHFNLNHHLATKLNLHWRRIDLVEERSNVRRRVFVERFDGYRIGLL